MGREIRRVPPDWKHPEEWAWSILTPWAIGHYGLDVEELERQERLRSWGWSGSQEFKRRSFVPMYDRSLRDAQEEWDADEVNIEGRTTGKGTADEQVWSTDEWCGKRPDPHAPRGYDPETGHGPEVYRPDWTDAERTAYQVYETVSEGTPVSPVFATVGELRAWLIEQGHSETAADKFIAGGWAPSLAVSSGVIGSGIDALDVMATS